MSGKRTVIRWQWGDAVLHCETCEAMTPEAIETMLDRTGRQFTARVRELAGYDEATAAVEPVEPSAD